MSAEEPLERGDFLAGSDSRPPRRSLPTNGGKLDCRVRIMATVKTSAIWLIAIALVVLVGGYFWYAGHAPADQPPLTSLSRENFGQLTGDFDRDSGDIRLVLLLSPT